MTTQSLFFVYQNIRQYQPATKLNVMPTIAVLDCVNAIPNKINPAANTATGPLIIFREKAQEKLNKPQSKKVAN